MLLMFDFTHSQTSHKNNSFTIKNFTDLPSWFKEAERTYMLNDDRISDVELIEFVGGYVPNQGEIFFINNSEIIFPDSQIKIEKSKTIITKTLTSGEYIVKITWDTELDAGSYSEGSIQLYHNNISVFNSQLIISGF